MQLRASVVLGLTFVVWTSPAAAYRPFDATDAAVAGRGELELEVGTLGYLRARDGSTYLGPAEVINFGPVERVELVLEGRPLVPAFRAAGQRFALVDPGASVKAVLREGILQAKAGPSVALELGALLPTIHAEPGAGAIADLITSEAVGFMLLHLNLEAARSRARNLALAVDLIAEGPTLVARTRPVAELSFEHELSVASTTAALVGIITQISDSLAPDAAVRYAVSGRERVLEIRGGFTWDIEFSRAAAAR